LIHDITNNNNTTTTNDLLTLFCLVDGESSPFSVDVERTKTVDKLKEAIKDKKAIAFADVDAEMLTLWRVSIPISEDDDHELPILLNYIIIKCPVPSEVMWQQDFFIH
jgi:uncharacterized protein YfeS